MAADNWNQQLKELRRLDRLHAFKMICSWCIASYALHGLISNCIFMYGSGLSGWFIWHTVWSTHHQPLTCRVCHSRLSSLSNKSHPLAVDQNTLAQQRAWLRWKWWWQGWLLVALCLFPLFRHPLGAWPLCDRHQRHIPRLELLLQPQDPPEWGTCVGSAPVQSRETWRAVLWEILNHSLSLSLWTCFHPLLLLHN